LLTLGVLLSVGSFKAYSQIPKPALVGYWQNWNNNLKLTDIHDNYNIIQIAFATTVGTSLSNMTFTLPSNYTVSTFKADIDALHSEGKLVILSIGGANDPVRLDNIPDRDEFISTINTILAKYDYKFDGIDIDLETTSLAFGSTWTMTSPSVGQINMIDAIKSIMENYKTQTGKKMILTMAPETIYLMGALSTTQLNNYNGGAMLPIIEELKEEIDLLHCQYYNAGGINGGTYAVDGKIYYDNSDPDYITSMTESIIKGFTLKNSKGVYSGFPESKVAIGLPAKSNTCAGITGSGYVTPDDVTLAVKYLQGKITKPAGWSYTVTKAYPDLAGLMTWSINNDVSNCTGANSFAENFPNAFPKITTSIYDKFSDESTKVFPNPTSGIVTIQLEKAAVSKTEVRVSNIIGVEVYSLTMNEGADSYQLDLSVLSRGVYILDYTIDGRKKSKRIIVK
jgi:chitinase